MRVNSGSIKVNPIANRESAELSTADKEGLDRVNRSVKVTEYLADRLEGTWKTGPGAALEHPSPQFEAVFDVGSESPEQLHRRRRV